MTTLDTFFNRCGTESVNGRSGDALLDRQIAFSRAVDQMHRFILAAGDPTLPETEYEVAQGRAAYYAQLAATVLHIMREMVEAEQAKLEGGW